MLENPCKPDCDRRSGTCHIDCAEYIAYDILNGILREQRLQEQQVKHDISETYHYTKKQKRRRPYADSRGGY